MYKQMAKILEEKEQGKFKLEKFTINPENRPWREYIPDGDYIRLIDKDDLWCGCVMSDTPMEQRTNTKFVLNAHGDVLIAGLGIGMIVLPTMEKDDVRSITIIEKYQEVIDMVLPQLPINNKVNVIQGDIFTHEFSKGTKFDTIYFDIWNYIYSDVYEEMKLLKKKYRKYLRSKKDNSNAFMSCWAEYQAKNHLPL